MPDRVILTEDFGKASAVTVELTVLVFVVTVPDVHSVVASTDSFTLPI